MRIDMDSSGVAGGIEVKDGESYDVGIMGAASVCLRMRNPHGASALALNPLVGMHPRHSRASSSPPRGILSHLPLSHPRGLPPTAFEDHQSVRASFITSSESVSLFDCSV